MPLTQFLTERILEYRIEKITKSNNAVVAKNDEWSVLDITTSGNIINLTSNHITDN